MFSIRTKLWFVNLSQRFWWGFELPTQSLSEGLRMRGLPRKVSARFHRSMEQDNESRPLRPCLVIEVACTLLTFLDPPINQVAYKIL